MSAFPELLPGMRFQCCSYFVITQAISEAQGCFTALPPSYAVGAALVSWGQHPQDRWIAKEQSRLSPLGYAQLHAPWVPFIPSFFLLSPPVTSFSLSFSCSAFFPLPYVRSFNSDIKVCSIPALHHAAVVWQWKKQHRIAWESKSLKYSSKFSQD